MSTATLWERVSDDPVVQGIYEASRDNGNTHTFALMCAERQPPGMRTDALPVGNRRFEDSFDVDVPCDAEMGELYRKNARAAGINPTGKVYKPGLARAGMGSGRDPDAWMDPLDGRAHIRKVMEKRGWQCEGLVDCDYTERGLWAVDAAPQPQCCEEIVDETTREVIRNTFDPSPKFGEKEFNRVKEEVREKLNSGY